MAEQDARKDEAAVSRCVQAIHSRWRKQPRAAIILGTGLGGLAAHIEGPTSFSYNELSGFQRPTAVAHKGQLVCGELAHVPIVAFEGRVHYYEQFSFSQITHPVRVAAALGCELLIVSNASGGLNPQFRSGDIMVVDDHIDLMGHRNACALAGRPAGSRGMPSLLYDPQLAAQAMAIGRRENFACYRGAYVAVTGPNYETRAEYRFMRRIGGDAVGMSTVPEVLAAAAHGLRVLALSAVTDVATPDAPDEVDALEVVDIAEHAEPKLRAIVMGILASLRVAT